MLSILKKSPLVKPQTRNAIHSTLPGKVLEKVLYCRRHCTANNLTNPASPSNEAVPTQLGSVQCM